ncbi:MAG: type II toxin-antitoxin system RelE/ParE family toxin [Candidatus Gottesmanbacteria bacterium]|nr:type II toxin-antitoxin system RelE/ParE family toxin [Candidatus Gottesmanbacteria bacterium]
MKITILPRAEKELRKFPKFDQLAVAQKIRLLPNPQVSGEEKLSGYPHVYRVRAGNYRIVYKKMNETIIIVLIRHRRDVYRMVKEILG